MENRADGGDPGNRLPLGALLAANAVSLLGNELATLAIPWFVLQTTGSAAKTGLTAAMTVLPVLLGGVFGGTLVDRLGHKRVSIVADLASGATVALIPLLHSTVGLPFALLLALVFLGALLDVPGAAARLSLAPELAVSGAVSLERANAAQQAIGRATQLGGPLLAGLLVAALGPGTALLLDAASFAVSAAAVAGALPAASRPRAAAADEGSYLTGLTAGWRLVHRDRLLLTLLAVSAVINLCLAPLYVVVLPVLAARTSGSARDLGWLFAAFGAGALLGTTLYGVAGPRLPRRAAYVGGVLLSAVASLALVPLPGLARTLGALLIVGVGIGPVDPILLTVAHERVPADLRGRFFGLMKAVAYGILPVGMLLAGLLLERFGLRTTLLVLTVPYLVFALGLLSNPVLRDMRMGTTPGPPLDTAPPGEQ